MMYSIITLLTALALASVAGWFSIIGFMTIYAGATTAALIMGAVTECAKIVTTSWLYRNWNYTSWWLKIPLVVFASILMAITSMGVFGFLSKAHLDQGASTVNNSAKVEQLDYQISREKANIDSYQKVITQLDDVINTLITQGKVNRSITVRRTQVSTRDKLAQDITAAQAKIDSLNDEKFKLEAEVRNLELEIGPIKYIADLFYSDTPGKDTIKSAVQIFTLLIVLSLDPLAVSLLIAANQSLMRAAPAKGTESEPVASSPEAPAPQTSTNMIDQIRESIKTGDQPAIDTIIPDAEFKQVTTDSNPTSTSVHPIVHSWLNIFTGDKNG